MRVLLLILLPLLGYFQQEIPKGTNTIKIKGVSFKEVAMQLLDTDYSFEKIDSNFQTVKTEFKEIKGYIPTIQLDIRVKDSVATIKGSWMSGGYVFSVENQKAPAFKATFKEMNDFALSFKKPVEYLSK